MQGAGRGAAIGPFNRNSRSRPLSASARLQTPRATFACRYDADTQRNSQASLLFGTPMRLNIFRSGRRLAMAFGALWAVIWITYVAFEEPGVTMRYAISWPDELAVREESCEWGDATRD